MSVWCFILAAGGSTRFGGAKALARWDCETLLDNAVAIAGRAFGDNVMLVTGGHDLPPLVPVIHNDQWQSGLGSSVATALRAAREKNATCALLLPVDQPLVTPAHLKALAERANDKVVLTRDGSVDGPPAAIPHTAFDVVQTLQGDRGLKSVIKDYDVVEAPGQLADIDTPDDLGRLTASRAKA